MSVLSNPHFSNKVRRIVINRMEKSISPLMEVGLLLVQLTLLVTYTGWWPRQLAKEFLPTTTERSTKVTSTSLVSQRTDSNSHLTRYCRDPACEARNPNTQRTRHHLTIELNFQKKPNGTSIFPPSFPESLPEEPFHLQ